MWEGERGRERERGREGERYREGEREWEGGRERWLPLLLSPYLVTTDVLNDSETIKILVVVKVLPLEREGRDKG